MFEAQMVAIGDEDQKEYSLYDSVRNLWLEIGRDDGMRFTAPQPVSLRPWYSEDDAGTRTFAAGLLAWMREAAETGEIVNNRFVDVLPADLDYVGIYSFMGKRPLLAPTGLEFDRDFKGKNTIFAVRGSIRVVDDYLSGYQKKYPLPVNTLKFKVINLDLNTKTVRVEHPHTELETA